MESVDLFAVILGFKKIKYGKMCQTLKGLQFNWYKNNIKLANDFTHYQLFWKTSKLLTFLPDPGSVFFTPVHSKRSEIILSRAFVTNIARDILTPIIDYVFAFTVKLPVTAGHLFFFGKVVDRMFLSTTFLYTETKCNKNTLKNALDLHGSFYKTCAVCVSD